MDTQWRCVMGLITCVVATHVMSCGDPDGGTGTESARAGTEEELRAEVEQALDELAVQVAASTPADADAAYPVLTSYLNAHADFFGSALALIGDDEITSPYVWREDGALAQQDLATPEYMIEQQSWFAVPRETQKASWTDPYFDEGGGDIWMVTRSVPLVRGETVYAIVTTDLPVSEP